MIYQDRQQSATLMLNGVNLLINLIDLNDEVTKNVSESSYFGDVSQFISTGRQARRFNCSINTHNVTHDLEADAIRQMLLESNTSNPLFLSHPYYGQVDVIAIGSISRNTNLVDSIMMSTLDFTLAEIEPLNQFESKLTEKANAFNEAVNEFLEENMKVENEKKFLDKLKDVYNGYKRILNKTNFFVQKGLNTVRDVNSKLKKEFYATVLKPAQIITTSKEILNLGVQNTPKQLVDSTKMYYETALSTPFLDSRSEEENKQDFDITEYDELDNSDFSLFDPKTADYDEVMLNLQNQTTCIGLMIENFAQTDVRDYSTMTELKKLIFFIIDKFIKDYEIISKAYDREKEILNLDDLRNLKAEIKTYYESLDLVRKEIYTIKNDSYIVPLLLEIYQDYNEEIYQTFIDNNPDLNSVVFFKQGQQCII